MMAPLPRQLPALWAALLALGLLVAAPVAAEEPPLVLRAQQKLMNLGYTPDPPGGLPGDATERAVREFQIDQELPVTGRLDRRTLEALGVGEPPVELGIDEPPPP